MGIFELHEVRVPNGQAGSRFTLKQFDGRDLIVPVCPNQLDGTACVGLAVTRGINARDGPTAEQLNKFVPWNSWQHDKPLAK